MTQYILSIDQGTTSSRAIIFDHLGNILAQAQQEFAQHFPKDGWVEHTPEDLWQTTLNSCREVIVQAGIKPEQIATCGITNQRETTLVWEKSTGKCIYPAIVWQDRRTAEYCAELKKDDGLVKSIQEKTGLLLDPYFSASKVRWILDHVEGAQARAEAGELLFGTVDSYILWQLTEGKSHKTDATNASRTLMFNIQTQVWDNELLALFNIPASMLPSVEDSAADFGMIETSLLGAEIPVQGIAGDQQAALFGQTCFAPGMAKSTYGTGCFMIVNTGEQCVVSNNRLLTTIAYRLNGQPIYALEGSIFMAGATIQWLRDGIQIIEHAKDTEALAKQVKQPNPVIMVPAFTGLGAPYWDPHARGAIFGLTRDTGIKEIVAAALQSVGLQTKDLQKAMEQDGQRPTTLRVDGGMVHNQWLMQYLADILGAPVHVPSVTETTALGVAYLAGLQSGIYGSLEQISELWQLQQDYTPQWSKPERDSQYQDWQVAVSKITEQ